MWPPQRIDSILQPQCDLRTAMPLIIPHVPWISLDRLVDGVYCAAENVGAFQLKSIRGSRSFSDSGRETINDDDVKQRLVPIVFTRA